MVRPPRGVQGAVRRIFHSRSPTRTCTTFSASTEPCAIRVGNAKNTRGTAFVVYEDTFDAKRTQESLNGQCDSRYLIVFYFQPGKR